MLFLPALFYSPKLDTFLIILAIVSFAGMGFFFYWEVLRPYSAKMRPAEMDPPEEGDVHEVVVPESTRYFRFSVGQISGDLLTLCRSIQDDHLVFILKKGKDSEDYDIQIQRYGPALVRPPRMQFFTKMESVEKLESHEIIGQTAVFRISDKITRERMTQYFEIGLTTAFFINKLGKERMKFLFTVQKIHPGLSLRSRDKKGLYSFGKEKAEEE
ncbi:hypothetical protein LEP1GSC058_2252 [Leptospira fainei serovar Hurstbridge str. BUT 6]|uniref:Uncharacterized protein n=1 Tax=Leptospira fainei serovar Hurstbridge str. BUT 6 TaxID=1193011 RepID=S3UYL3_9LEPT|nr:hypothetical protein [Leptospira fainei]EPG75501.1 hypothetical protein LEP1GSC058_2252 [Leptospira fainei serovar Hurstbridge str. BUT 6]